MDCTKAFDTIKHSILFKKLLAAGVPAIFLRILVFMYREQTADVRWKSSNSKEFTIRNGVRQGAVLSPILFCFYMNELFSEMKKSGAGCHIDEYYAGMFGYADDLLLLCPSRDGLQKMLEIAEKYANDHRISFSTNIDPNKSKTKGIIFFQKGNDCTASSSESEQQPAALGKLWKIPWKQNVWSIRWVPE